MTIDGEAAQRINDMPNVNNVVQIFAKETLNIVKDVQTKFMVQMQQWH